MDNSELLNETVKNPFRIPTTKSKKKTSQKSTSQSQSTKKSTPQKIMAIGYWLRNHFKTSEYHAVEYFEIQTTVYLDAYTESRESLTSDVAFDRVLRWSFFI